MAETPEQSGAQFSSPEEEIAALERRLAEKRAELLTQEEDKREHGVERTPEQEKEQVRQEIEQHVAETPQPSTPVDDTAKQPLQGQPQTQQVTMLVELALEKGVVHAVKVAEELEDPYLLDRLHDELVNHFYDQLLQSEEDLRDV